MEMRRTPWRVRPKSGSLLTTEEINPVRTCDRECKETPRYRTTPFQYPGSGLLTCSTGMASGAKTSEVSDLLQYL